MHQTFLKEQAEAQLTFMLQLRRQQPQTQQPQAVALENGGVGDQLTANTTAVTALTKSVMGIRKAAIEKYIEDNADEVHRDAVAKAAEDIDRDDALAKAAEDIDSDDALAKAAEDIDSDDALAKAAEDIDSDDAMEAAVDKIMKDHNMLSQVLRDERLMDNLDTSDEEQVRFLAKKIKRAREKQ